MNGFKKTVLAATAVFVLGLSANAQAFLIDSFDSPQSVLDATVGGAVSSGALGGFTNTDLGAGATRTLTADMTGNTIPALLGDFEVEVIGGFMTVDSDSGVSGTAMVDWTGFAATDLTVGMGIGIVVDVIASDADGGSTATFTLTKSDLTTIDETVVIPAVGVCATCVPSPFSHLFDFGAAFAGATDIVGINLTITGVSDLDVTIDLIETATVPEPGTMLLMGSGLLGLGLWRRFKK